MHDATPARSTILALAAALLLVPGVPAAQAPGPPAEARPDPAPVLDRPAALVLAQRYHQLASRHVEPDLLGEYARLVPGKPRFDGQGANPARATELSASVAFLVGHTNACNFYLATATAAFAFDPASPTAAGNLAAAIVTFGEDGLGARPDGKARDGLLAPFRDDAVALYRYALTLTGAADPAVGGLGTVGSAPGPAAAALLVNLGNLDVDLHRLEEAQAAFKRALQVDPHSWPAHQGLAAYYLAINRKDLAEKELSRRELMPSSRRKAAQAADRTGDEVSPPVEPGDGEAAMEAKLARLREVEPVSQADFIEELDQAEASKLRAFVRNLAAEATFKAPGLETFVVYGDLRSFSRPIPKVAFKEWSQKWGRQIVAPMAVKQGASGLQMLERMGMKVHGLDVDDMARNPQNYTDGKKRKATVTGREEAKAWAAEMKASAQKARSGDKAAQQEVIKKLDKVTHDGNSILLLNPYDFANPSDVLIQKLNILELNKKLHAYRSYLRKVSDRFDSELTAIREPAVAALTRLAKEEEDAMEALDREIAEKHLDHDQALLKRHHLHELFHRDLNEVKTHAWSRSTLLANAEYLRRLKPNIEAMFADCFRHVLHISDPEVRAQRESDLSAAVLGFLAESLERVTMAYGGVGSYSESWQCGCDLRELALARERERQEFDEAQAAAITKNRAARKQFMEGGIPETSPLYKKLDAYTVTFAVPPPPLPAIMEAKIGVLRSSLKLTLATPGLTGPRAAAMLELVNDHARETTTITGGIESGCKVATKDGRASLDGKLWTKATVTLSGDDKVVVKDWDVSAGAALTGSIGTGGTKAGSASLQGTVAYEASIMRGNSFSAEVAAVAMPTLAGAGGAFKATDMNRSVLWTGKYPLD